MAPFEKLAITLRPDDLAFIDQIAREKAVGRSAVIRWAIDQYRAFLISSNSIYQTIRHDEDTDTSAHSDTNATDELP